MNTKPGTWGGPPTLAELIGVMSGKHLKQWRRGNCTKLADFLEGIDPTHINLARWGTVDECGTVACALGWAVLSGRFTGLTNSMARGGTLTPVVDGVGSDWRDVAALYFPHDALDAVFGSAPSRFLTPRQAYAESYDVGDWREQIKAGVIAKLRELALKTDR